MDQRASHNLKKVNRLTYGLGGMAPPSPSLLLLVASVAVRGDGPRAMGDRWRRGRWRRCSGWCGWVVGNGQRATDNGQRATGSGEQAAGDGQRREMGSGG